VRENTGLRNVITDDELNRYFSAITCRSMALIFDCCLSGGLVDSGAAADAPAAAAFAGRFAGGMQTGTQGDVNGDNRVALMSTRPGYLERGISLTGFPLAAGLAFACSHPKLTDRNADGIVSAEEAFTVARPLVGLQSSLLWLGVWLYSSALYQQEPWAFAHAAADTALAYGAVQLVIKALDRHYMGNFPVMADGCAGELPLIVY
jgi:hypothetical protein